MARAVTIPVTVKMRAGWDASAINAPDLAKRVEDAGAAAVTVHGRTAAQSYSGSSDWDLIGEVAAGVRIPVFGSGDCLEPHQLIDRLRGTPVQGVLVGRGALRNPWIFEQAAALVGGLRPRDISQAERGRFLLEDLDLLLQEGSGESEGFRHVAPGQGPVAAAPARGRERWVINKLRALNTWYTKGLDNGSHLRVAINAADSIAGLRELIHEFFVERAAQTPAGVA
jgi:tRNA-dihydrouridine synthase